MPRDEETLGTVALEIRDLLKDILAALGGGNTGSWNHGRCVVSTPGEPQRLPPMHIPDGMHVVVRALPRNTGSVYIGRNSQAVLDPDRRIELTPKDFVRMRLTNTNLIWVDAEKDGEGVDFWCEAEK